MRHLSLLPLLLACSTPDAPAPDAPGSEAAVAPPAAAPADAPPGTAGPASTAAFDAKAFACCDTAEALSVVQGYLALQERLSGDDLPGAQAAAGALATTVDGVAASAAEADKAALTAMAGGLATVKTADVAAAREAFKGVSAAALTYAQAHVGGEAKVAQAYCPMADASWIQKKTTVDNPYYGAEMLTCGYFK